MLVFTYDPDVIIITCLEEPEGGITRSGWSFDIVLTVTVDPPIYQLISITSNSYRLICSMQHITECAKRNKFEHFLNRSS